jgi:GT2 family glycosyltransferase
MDVSILFVNYNTISLLIDAIDSVYDKTTGLDFEIIVVDNASTDNSKELLWNKYQDKVIYLALPKNIGFGRANNEGMKVAKGRNVFLLNPDTILKNNAIKILSDFLDSNYKAGVAGANLFNEDGSPQPSYSLTFPSIGFALSNLTHALFFYDRETFNTTDIPKRTLRVVGAALMVKKEVVDVAGAFNPEFFMYAEEDEWCYRIRKAGYHIYNVPHAEITHLDGKSFQFSEQRQKRQLEGLRTLYRVCYSPLYCSLLRKVEYATIISRLFTNKISGNRNMITYWNFMYDNRKWK